MLKKLRIWRRMASLIVKIVIKQDSNQHPNLSNIYHQEMRWVKLVCAGVQDLLQLACVRRVGCLVIRLAMIVGSTRWERCYDASAVFVQSVKYR